jgi:hypothetical protein
VSMAIKAVWVDKEGVQHLIIGLSRENVNTLVDGEVFTLPQGLAASITSKSDIVLLFADRRGVESQDVAADKSGSVEQARKQKSASRGLSAAQAADFSLSGPCAGIRATGAQPKSTRVLPY